MYTVDIQASDVYINYIKIVFNIKNWTKEFRNRVFCILYLYLIKSIDVHYRYNTVTYLVRSK